MRFVNDGGGDTLSRGFVKRLLRTEDIVELLHAGSYNVSSWLCTQRGAYMEA
jgi:hypothetical protein